MKKSIDHALKMVPAGLLLLFLFLTCGTPKDLVPTKTRQLRPSEISSYHQPVKMQIAWVPYENKTLVQTRKNEWKIVDDPDASKTTALPSILVNYPGTNDTIWLGMDMDNELLGRLVKHTLMTQIPISRPFTEYFAVADCRKCHPSHIKADLR